MSQTHGLEFLNVQGLRWHLSFSPSRTEPAAGKETGAAKVSKNLELARLTPASSSARELGPVGLQGGPGGPGDPAPGIEGDRGRGGGLYPMRSVSTSPPHCLLGSLCPWASPPSWWVSTACPSPYAPTSPRLVDEVGSGSSGTPTPSLASSPLPQPKLTPQEKLKLRMQKALNRQCMSPRLFLGSSKAPFLPAWP